MANEELIFIQWYSPTNKEEHNALYGLPVSIKKLGERYYECLEGVIYRSTKHLYLSITDGSYITRFQNTRDASNFYVLIKHANIVIPIDGHANLYMHRIWNKLYYKRLQNNPDELKDIVCDLLDAFNKIPQKKIFMGADNVKQHYEKCMREVMAK